MKYVQNNGRYALSFEIIKDGRTVKVAFDRRRFYLDTGNIATTGITAVEDEDFEKLNKIKQFKALFEKGDFVLTEETKIETAETKVKALEAENKKLEAELKKAKGSAGTKETQKQLADKDKEISDLKAKLEALTKDKGAEKDETEGF